MGIIQAIFVFLRAFIMAHATAAAEILALRQQVAVFKQSVKRPKLRPVTGLSGCYCLGSGRTGDPLWQ